ncbi:MAG TPA: hypothetical protein DEG17_09605 [Cyanobacteria bacterium UBA11149]|nr:hypothetical protein [Cyanobacteria bacterium UBA11367]HBE57126.1 hypothetical protein [Cyanobacteria bacterium UBA11366]HBK64414.1 hypothetical protein [Cyanobacteria bacterium UBA11166]HBR75769.1 hypothetical protein [Cyanobacteria bacterium UBA11159]HBS69813.1 hypothetical protein [Cyanobacteria bacterium UBA11153]HBW89103.1 hypothetical protein [Cyanobacteria bacterium UBA11149]HCA96973.1 hypothetical protein [Cyanobacteria bacterium UBA9226]
MPKQKIIKSLLLSSVVLTLTSSLIKTTIINAQSPPPKETTAPPEEILSGIVSRLLASNPKFKELSQEISNLKQENQRLKDRINNLENTNKNLAEELEENQSRLQELSENLTKLAEENKNLKSQVNSVFNQSSSQYESQQTFQLVTITTFAVAMGGIGVCFYILFQRIKQLGINQPHTQNPDFSPLPLHAEQINISDLESPTQIQNQETHLQNLELDENSTHQTESQDDTLPDYPPIMPWEIKTNQEVDSVDNQNEQMPENQEINSESHSLEVEKVAEIQAEESNTTSYEEFVEIYNTQPGFWLKQAIPVSETDESLNQRNISSSQSAVFQQNRRGNYWILTIGEVVYLVPKVNLRINEFTYKTVQSFFECRGYQVGYSSQFKLLKPARVSPVTIEDKSIPTEDKWELVELGILQF